MPSILTKLKTEITKSINQCLPDAGAQADDIIIAPNPDFGDLALPCFGLAKKIGQPPAQIAAELVKNLVLPEAVSSCRAIGPYLNFILNKSDVARELLKDIESAGDQFGQNDDGGRKKVMVEYSNVNTHKEFHVGHLRNISFGDAVQRILAANGYDVMPVSYINDFGIHVAKTIWALKNFYQNEKIPANKGYFLGKVYVRATGELDNDPTVKNSVGLIMKNIESRTGDEYKTWQETRAWSIAQFDKIYAELGVKFFHTFYESEFVDAGRRMVEEMLDKGILVKSQGAVIADLEKYNLGVLMFFRSDGTALYPVADLPLAREKFEKFKADKSIYVIDVRQSLYMKQLAKVMSLLGFSQEMFHLGFEFVKLPSGMMSSRTGNTVTYEELRDLALDKARAETAKRHPDWPADKTESVVGKIVNGVIKFEMLKVGAGQIIVFDLEKGMRFDGFTSAYLQYVYARVASIRRKIPAGETKADYACLAGAKEFPLIMRLINYPEIVAAAAAKYDPSEIAKYLFELGREFSDYYHSVSIVKSEPGAREARLALALAVAQTIKNGLGLLGIEVMEEM